MKTIFIFHCLVISMIFGGCTQPKSSLIKGTWKWISYESRVGDTLKWKMTGADPQNSGIKMWSDNYFVAIYRIGKDTIFKYSYSGGTYHFEGTLYEETVIYHDMINIPELVGTKEMMLLEIKKDTLFQTYPVDENGNLFKKNTIIEKFVRLD